MTQADLWYIAVYIAGVFTGMAIQRWLHGRRHHLRNVDDRRMERLRSVERKEDT